MLLLSGIFCPLLEREKGGWRGKKETGEEETKKTEEVVMVIGMNVCVH